MNNRETVQALLDSVQKGDFENVKSMLAEGMSSNGTFFRSIGHWMGRRNLSTFEVTEFVERFVRTATNVYRNLAGLQQLILA